MTCIYVQYTHIRWQCHSCWALRQFMQTSNSEVLFIAGCAVGQWPKFLESVPPDLNVGLYFSYFGALSGIWLPYHKLHEQKHGTRWGKEHGFLQTMNQKFCYNKIKKNKEDGILPFILLLFVILWLMDVTNLMTKHGPRNWIGGDTKSNVLIRSVGNY